MWSDDLFDVMNPSDNFGPTAMAREGTGHDDQQFSPTGFFEDDDGVFDGAEETEMPNFQTRTSRVRRTSDVIDSVGDLSPSHATKDKANSFTYESSYTTSYSSNYTMQDFRLQSPPKGRPISTATDGPLSPPMTPGSDLGYVSTGASTPPSILLRRSTKSFRFSTSSADIPASPPRWDTQTDAKLLGGEPEVTPPSNVEKPVAVMASEKSSRAYNMKHKKRGHAIIFNHEDFRDQMPARVGSGIDVKRLESALKYIEFEVEVHKDLEVEKLKSILIDVSNKDHSDNDCLVVIVLTHGLGTGCLMAKDYAYPVEHLWSPFAGDKCTSLAGKPKLFFIQACRGEKLDGGLRVVRKSYTQVDNNTPSYRIPTMADFLLAFSTFEGFYSWRHPEKGTWFIQCLCEVIEEEGLKSSLQDILLEVSRRVATDYESYNDVYVWQHEQKQVPQINSTLLRQVYFHPKK